MRSNDVKVIQLLSNTQKTADFWCNYVDRANFDKVTFIVSANMTTADSSNYFTPVLKEATATPGTIGSYASVDSSEIVNGAFAAIVATGAATVQQVDYIGDARYLTVLLDETSTADGVFSVFAVLSGARKSPAENETVTTGAVS